MQCAPSEVFHYADNRGQCDSSHLSRSSSVLQAAKKDLLGIIQLQVAPPPAAPGQVTPPPPLALSG